jgi:hypothetical protein
VPGYFHSRLWRSVIVSESRRPLGYRYLRSFAFIRGYFGLFTTLETR